MVMLNVGMYTRTRVVETVRRTMLACRAVPSASCDARLGKAHASAVLMRLPQDRLPKLQRLCATFFAAPFRVTRPIHGARGRILIQGEHFPAFLHTTCRTISDAGGNIEQIDLRVFPNTPGPEQNAMDLKLVVPAAVGIAGVCEEIRRRTTSPIRIYDGDSGRPIVVREYGDPARGARRPTGPLVRFVGTSASPDQPGITAALGQFLHDKEAIVDRVTGYACGGQFVLLVEGVCSDLAYEEILTTHRAALPQFNTSFEELHWSPIDERPGETGRRLVLEGLDDITAASPLWSARRAAEKAGVRLGGVNIEYADRPWFGSLNVKLEAVLRGTPAALDAFSAEAANWRDGYDVGITADAKAVFKDEGDVDQPFRLIQPHTRDDWEGAFEDA